MVAEQHSNIMVSLRPDPACLPPLPGTQPLAIQTSQCLPYFLYWNARVLLVSSELLAGVVFEGAFYSRAQSIPFSLSVTNFFSKHNNFKFKGFIIMFSFFFIQRTVRFIY